MASFYRHSSRNGWCVQLCLPTGQRVVLWVGNVSKAGAKDIARYVERLAVASAANVAPPAEALRWAMGTDKRIKSRLVQWGLVPYCNLGTYTIGSWTDHYCEIRDDVDATTRKKYQNARRRLLLVIEDKDLRSVTPADADRFARSLAGADSTVGKVIKTVKQLFSAAVDERLIEHNPFARLRGANNIDESRSAYVGATEAEAVLKQIATPECRLAFLFARWAGLRIPSEILTLSWTDIDWDAETILIHSPKGERYKHRATRLIPLFPRLKQPLLDAAEAAPDRSTWVIERYRDTRPAARWFRTQLLKAIEAANQPIWAKVWVNLRASCRTDLEQHFPVHVCDDWLGHSDAVARKHYKRVTPEHFAAVPSACAVTGAVNKSE